ncbi:MAG: hypothetical protein ACI867_001008, partial [Glaciecola sp.]
ESLLFGSTVPDCRMNNRSHSLALTLALRRSLSSLGVPVNVVRFAMTNDVRVRFIAGFLLLAMGLSLLVSRPAQAQESTLLVPQDHATIQGAVDAANAGDTIVVDRGEYNEEVFVGEGKDNLTIRGVDRNEVILDGNNEMAIAIFVKAANGVRIENMTAREYTGNGFYWQSVDGYVGRYLTAYHIGIYGIYAFDSRLGLFEDSYASGSADSSFYIGQCYPCDATIRNVVGEYSIIGYSGTNAGGNLSIEDSVWNFNGAGMIPNSLDGEANPPQREATLSRNIVTGSGTVPVPVKGIFEIANGLGIAVAGGIGNIVEDNVVTGSTRYGIVVTILPDQNVWQPKDNTVRNNTVSDSGADDPLGTDLAILAASDTGNCFTGNTFETSDPPQIETLWPCDGPSLSQAPGGGSIVAGGNLLATYALAAACQEGIDPACNESPTYDSTPIPPAQLTMPANEAGKSFAGGPAEQEAAGAPQSAGLSATQATVAMPAAATAATSSLPATGGGVISLLAGLGLLVSGARRRRQS